MATEILHRHGAVWVSETGETYTWDDNAEFFYPVLKDVAYVPIERRGEDEVLIECLN